MIPALIANLQADIALIQQYSERRAGTGFQDMSRILEALSIPLFRAWRGYDLQSMNQIQVNFPAIDLADAARKVAVQVTSNANATKVKETIRVYEAHKFHLVYDHLHILGFNKISATVVPSYCTVVGIDHIVNDLLDRGEEDDIQVVLDAIKKHHSYPALHPWDDRGCLEIVLNYVDRSAIKHVMSVEGDAIDMVRGLDEITELIGKGQVHRRVKSKSMDDFQDVGIRTYLREVKDLISEIKAIVYGARSPGTDFVYLNEQQSRRIDELKETIADLSNEIARNHGIPLVIQLKRRWG